MSLVPLPSFLDIYLPHPRGILSTPFATSELPGPHIVWRRRLYTAAGFSFSYTPSHRFAKLFRNYSSSAE